MEALVFLFLFFFKQALLFSFRVPRFAIWHGSDRGSNLSVKGEGLELLRREQSEYPDQNREQNDQSDVPQVSHAPFTRVTLLTHDFERGQTTTRQQGQQPKASSSCHHSGINAVSLKKTWRFHHPRRKKIIVSKGNDVCLKPHYQFHQHSFQLYGVKIFNLLTIKMRK